MPGTIAIFKPFPTFHQLVGLYRKLNKDNETTFIVLIWLDGCFYNE
jgi:hypothetical protein